ncbi:MAG: transcriptional regulator [Candidatus Methanomethylicia archaeon]|jgi:predicted DNA-binding transcriptional regulator|uniref:Transcriptional regulator n=1 Tax=Thermoproteota archaeon TaxID=2056631 RepID=A0A520KGU7_9CREN|nr:transcriptional regulator [Candidatus Methanomethylicia archaeon]MCQ5341204.1 transcriptional regulator [Candidatus Methanomethylicia archaeon]RZN57665.1 MAG: transcriptional regulator [Candidatus Verstraetearchaeota archaeon]TDA40341.1 MAG: transcriptional regulator [Candidatus Verstraetearchaeota archaeon]
MHRDMLIGSSLLIVSIIIIIAYIWLVFFTAWDLLILKLTGSIAIIAIFGILAWIGYTLATTPPPKPIEEIEKEIEEEMKKTEETKKENA